MFEQAYLEAVCGAPAATFGGGPPGRARSVELSSRLKEGRSSQEDRGGLSATSDFRSPRCYTAWARRADSPAMSVGFGLLVAARSLPSLCPRAPRQRRGLTTAQRNAAPRRSHTPPRPRRPRRARRRLRRGSPHERRRSRRCDRSARGISLARCLELAERNHPNIWAARARLTRCARSSTRRTSRRSASSPRPAGFGIAPTVRGNNIYSPNTEVSLSSSMGVAWRVGIEGVIPLWTFGKMTNLWDAAEAQIRVGESRRQQAEEPGARWMCEGLFRPAARARFAGAARRGHRQARQGHRAPRRRGQKRQRRRDRSAQAAHVSLRARRAQAPRRIATRRSRSRRSVFSPGRAGLRHPRRSAARDQAAARAGGAVPPSRAHEPPRGEHGARRASSRAKRRSSSRDRSISRHRPRGLAPPGPARPKSPIS